MTRFGIVLSFLTMMGCPSSSPGKADCSPFQGCGGDVVGTWQFVGSCSMGALVSSCPSASFDTSNYHAELTFGSDGRLVETFSGSAIVNYPNSCFGVDGGVATTCSNLSRPPGQTCTQTSSSCSCQIDISQAGTSGFQTNYSTSGSNLTLTLSFSDASAPVMVTYEYCVQGNSLKLKYTAGAMFEAVYTRK
jgi:hypothetical protein